VTSASGTFEFTNLLTGGDYSVSIEATSFKTLLLTDVKVSLNQATDLSAQLAPGTVTESVTVTAGGTELVDTTTSNLSQSFSSRQVSELGQTGAGASGVNNLALLAPNVSSSGGVGVGTGGSVGGQRARNNNFMIDGVDNNDKSVTGPQSYVSPEEVLSFHWSRTSSQRSLLVRMVVNSSRLPSQERTTFTVPFIQPFAIVI
jgi:hypothetical protein